MSKSIKYVGVAFAVVIGVVVAGVAIIASTDVNQFKPHVIDAVRDATGRELSVSGELELEVSFSPRIAVEDVTLSNAPWAENPEMISVGRFAAQVELIPLISGDIRVQEVILQDVNVSLERGTDGAANWTFGTTGASQDQPAAASGQTPLPVVNRAVLENVRLQFRDAVSNSQYEINLEELTLSADSVDSPLNLKASGDLNESELTLSLVGGSLAQLAAGEGRFPLQAELGAFDVDTKFSGDLGMKSGAVATIDGSLDASSEKLASTLEQLASFVPAVQAFEETDVDVFQLRGDVRYDNTSVAVTGLSLKLGESDLAGNMSVSFSPKIALSGNLLSNKLNVTQLLPETEDPVYSQSERDEGDRLFPDDPLPFDVLESADAELGIEVKELVLPGLSASDFKTMLKLDQGTLNIGSLSLGIFDGSVEAKAAIDASNIRLETNISSVNYAQILEMQGIEDLVQGTLDGEISLTGSGASVRQIMAGLDGSIFVSTENGRIESAAMGLLGSDLLGALPGMGSTDSTILQCGVVNFDVSDGIAGVRALVFETPALSVIGAGGANLKDESLNIVADPRARTASLASAAAVPVTIGGTFVEPAVSVDAAALAKGAAGTVARGAAAISTMGLSLLAESVAKRAQNSVDTTDYCGPALAGSQVVRNEATPATSPSDETSSQEAPPAQNQPASGVIKGVQDGLKSLFGN